MYNRQGIPRVSTKWWTNIRFWQIIRETSSFRYRLLLLSSDFCARSCLWVHFRFSEGLFPFSNILLRLVYLAVHVIHDPPIIILDQALRSLDDWIEIILLWVHLRHLFLCSHFGTLQKFEESNFLVREVRMPKITDEDHSGLLTVVPCLVLERVIEHIAFSESLLHGLICNP